MLILVECWCSVVKRAGPAVVRSTVRRRRRRGRRRGEVVGSAVVAWGLMTLLQVVEKEPTRVPQPPNIKHAVLC